MTKPSALSTPRASDPVAVVRRRGPDGKFHETRRFLPWVRPARKGDPAPPAFVDTPPA